jgi:hypothetical protein
LACPRGSRRTVFIVKSNSFFRFNFSIFIFSHGDGGTYFLGFSSKTGSNYFILCCNLIFVCTVSIDLSICRCDLIDVEFIIVYSFAFNIDHFVRFTKIHLFLRSSKLIFNQVDFNTKQLNIECFTPNSTLVCLKYDFES